MQKIEFTEDYRFAHRGVEVVEYTKGQVVDASDELADSAKKDKVAKSSNKPTDEEQAAAKVETSAHSEAPENTAASSAPETK